MGNVMGNYWGYIRYEQIMDKNKIPSLLLQAHYFTWLAWEVAAPSLNRLKRRSECPTLGLIGTQAGSVNQCRGADHSV